MPPLVLDTNVFVAAGFRSNSASARIVEAAASGRLQVVWDDPTRRESEHVVDRIPPLDVARLSDIFRDDQHFEGETHPERFEQVPDAADRKFAALAEAAGAVLVTQDDHLLGCRDELPFPVLTPGEAADRYLGDS